MTDLAAATASAAGSSPQGMPWLKAYPKDVEWSRTYQSGPLHELLDQAVTRFPDNVCTYFLGQRTSYGEIGRAVDQFAAGLQRLGVGKGTRVGLFLPNSPTFIVAYFAVLKAGGTVVNYNPLYSIPEVEHQARDSGTTLMVTVDLKLLFDKVEALLASGTLDRAIVASFSALLPTVKSVLFRVVRGREVANIEASAQRSRVVTQRELLTGAGKPTAVAIDPKRDLAVLQYTGGTTGTPKGAMLTHANLRTNVEQCDAWATTLGSGPDQVVMGILPLFHVFAMTLVMNFGIQRAGCIILVPKFDMAESLKLMTTLRPTILPGVPTLFNAILNYKGTAKADLTSLRWCMSGGAPLPPEVKRRFEALTGATLIEGYGLSETSPVITGNPCDGRVKEGSIGLPLPSTYVSIRSLDDPARELPIWETGEICVAGPQVMQGYWNKPEENAAAFVDGAGGRYFRTGDIGRMDAEGFTFISDRLKDMINASGFKVYPRRVEDALYEHPAVEEVVVIGVPDAYRGEAPKAFVKLREGKTATAEELTTFLVPRLAKTEMPAAIEFRTSLPKTMVGKLSKKELKAEEAARRVGGQT